MGCWKVHPNDLTSSSSRTLAEQQKSPLRTPSLHVNAPVSVIGSPESSKIGKDVRQGEIERPNRLKRRTHRNELHQSNYLGFLQGTSSSKWPGSRYRSCLPQSHFTNDVLLQGKRTHSAAMVIEMPAVFDDFAPISATENAF